MASDDEEDEDNDDYEEDPLAQKAKFLCPKVLARLTATTLEHRFDALEAALIRSSVNVHDEANMAFCRVEATNGSDQASRRKRWKNA